MISNGITISSMRTNNVPLPSAFRPIGSANQRATPTNCFGTRGWWRVPENLLFGNIPGWTVTKDSVTRQLFATDPNGLRLALSTNESGQLVFKGI